MSLCLVNITQAATLRVGPGKPIARISDAARAAQDGDTIEIEAGNYVGDTALWRANNLTLRGVHGMAHLHSKGASVERKAIWVIEGNNTIVENIGFYDAQVSDRNGAGIRLVGANLTVRNCLFRNNENGIMTGPNPNSEVLIDNSEFVSNGYGDGRSHNIYIGPIRKFTLRKTLSHQARVGHQVKSRAAENVIVGNQFKDGPTGRSSYLIDLPAGGVAYIAGNTLQKGRMSVNATMISYGAERLLYANNGLVVKDNLFINERDSSCLIVNVHKGLTAPALVVENRFLACDRLKGHALGSRNTRLH